MKNYVTVENGFVGFGLSRELAVEDSKWNQLRQASVEVDDKYKERRKQLHPWLPRPNMLHITGVGCIMTDGQQIWDAANSSKKMLCWKYSIFYILQSLFPGKLSFEDICFTIREELDTLFSNVSADVVLIKDMPPIRLGDKRNDFTPYVKYFMDDGIVIAFGEKEVGVKRIYEPMYHTVDLPEQDSIVDIVAYIACRMRILFNDTTCLEIGVI